MPELPGKTEQKCPKILFSVRLNSVEEAKIQLHSF